MDASAARVVAESSAGRRWRVVVVGGGIAGLAAAHAVLLELPGAQVTLLEASSRTGGKLRVGEIAGQAVDLGAEAILNRRPEAVGLAAEVGLSSSLVYPLTTSAGIWTRGAVRQLPRTVMGVPADLADLAQRGIVNRKALVRARLERGDGRLDVSEDVGVGGLVSRRLGADVRDRLVEPMLGGVYAGRADELSLHATIPQLVPAIREHGSLTAAARAVATAGASTPIGSPRPVFAGIDGGVGRLAAAVEGAIVSAGAAVRCEVTVREVGRSADGFRIVAGPTVAVESVDADAVVVATPAGAAAKLLRHTVPDAAMDLARIEYASMAVVTLAIRASDVSGEIVGSGFLVPPIDRRQIKAATFSSRKWGWLSDELVVVRCSLGRSGEEQQLQRDDAELVEAAAMDLRKAVGLRGQLAGAVVTRWGGALPQYTVGHLDRVRRIRDAVDRVPGLAVCGAAYDGLGIAACIASAQEAATRVVADLRARETMAG